MWFKFSGFLYWLLEVYPFHYLRLSFHFINTKHWFESMISWNLLNDSSTCAIDELLNFPKDFLETICNTIWNYYFFVFISHFQWTQSTYNWEILCNNSINIYNRWEIFKQLHPNSLLTKKSSVCYCFNQHTELISNQNFLLFLYSEKIIDSIPINIKNGWVIQIFWRS